MIKGFYGISVAVKDLDEAVANYEAFFETKAGFLSGYEARLAFPDLDEAGLDYQSQTAVFEVQGFRVTLITSTDENSVVGRFLKHRGEGVFMVSMEVDDAEKESRRLKDRGKQLVFDKCARGNFGVTNFVHPRSMNGVQFEVYQPSGIFKS